jgi:hypothetical protein
MIKNTTQEAYSSLNIDTFTNWANRLGYTVEFTEINKYGIPMVGLVNGQKIGSANKMYAFFRKENKKALQAARLAA